MTEKPPEIFTIISLAAEEKVLKNNK